MTIDQSLIMFGTILSITAYALAGIMVIVAIRSYRAHTAPSRERKAIFSLRGYHRDR